MASATGAKYLRVLAQGGLDPRVLDRTVRAIMVAFLADLAAKSQQVKLRERLQLEV